MCLSTRRDDFLCIITSSHATIMTREIDPNSGSGSGQYVVGLGGTGQAALTSGCHVMFLRRLQQRLRLYVYIQ